MKLIRQRTNFSTTIHYHDYKNYQQQRNNFLSAIWEIFNFTSFFFSTNTHRQPFLKICLHFFYVCKHVCVNKQVTFVKIYLGNLQKSKCRSYHVICHLEMVRQEFFARPKLSSYDIATWNHDVFPPIHYYCIIINIDFQFLLFSCFWQHNYLCSSQRNTSVYGSLMSGKKI